MAETPCPALRQSNHPLQRGIGAHRVCPHGEGAVLVHGAAGNGVTRLFVHRDTLTGHHRLVNGGFSLQDGAVHRHGFPGKDAQHIADPDLLHGDDLGLPVPQHTGRLWRDLDQLLDALPRFAGGVILQQGTDLHDQRHFTGGKEFPGGGGGDQGQRNQLIRFDVMLKHDSFAGLTVVICRSGNCMRPGFA